MKISNRILLVGIICIFLGTLGIIWGIAILLLPKIFEMPIVNTSEIPNSLLRWNTILEYIGILVNAFYLTAGILFLLKKHFSFKIIYSALIISIMYKIIPMLFLNQYSGQEYFHSYGFNIVNLIGPIFNTALFVFVYRIGSFYHKLPKEDIGHSKEKMNKINFLIYGSILLVLSSAFLDVDIIALLAMPVFLLSIVLILIFYLSLISKDSPNKKIAISLIISGTLLLSADVGYLAVEFIEYLRNISESLSEEFFSSLGPIIGVYILASLILLIGIKQNRVLNNRKLFLVWLPTLGILPSVMIVIKLLKLYQLGI